MRQPEVYSAEAIKSWPNSMEMPSGKWVPCRPLGHNLYSFRYRIRIAWYVFTGRYDALIWCDYPRTK
jgi:hypothetical protein